MIATKKAWLFGFVLLSFSFLLCMRGRGVFSAQTQPPSGVIRLAIFKPQVQAGTLSAVAFVDRLLVLLRKEPGVEVELIENAVDHPKARELAAQQHYDFLLFLTISGVEDKSLGAKAGSVVGGIGKRLPGMKDKTTLDPRFLVRADYVLEAIGKADPLLSSVVESRERKEEESVNKVVTAIAEAVLRKAKEVGKATLANSPAPIAPVGETRQPNPSNAADIPLARPRLVVQTAHSTMVTDYAYSPKGDLLATLGADGVVKLWNTDTGKEINTFSGFRTVGIAFSPDGKLLAALGKEGIARLFDVASGRLLRRLAEIQRSKKNKEREDFLNLPVSIVFGPDGNSVVHGGQDGIKVWDVTTGRAIRAMEKEQFVPTVAFSPKGNLIAGVVEDNKIKFLSAATGQVEKEIHSKVGYITALAFSPDCVFR